MNPTPKVVDFLINHLVLPIQLPQEEDDPDTEREGEQCLLHLLSGAVETFIDKTAVESLRLWRPVRSALKNLLFLSRGYTASKSSLKSIFQGLRPTDAIILHVKAQNAGLVFFRPDSSTVIVHAFEASAQCKDVMESCDRLTWSFPGQSVRFSSCLLDDENFIEEIATMVHNMSNEPVEPCMPTSRKSTSTVSEERDTTHPGLVTEALIPMLESLGTAYESPQIIKHVRDDVNWDDCFSPWRRSPFWLVLRVGIQLLLSHASTTDEGRAKYKNFMAFFMASVCGLVMKNPVKADLRQIAAVKATRRLSKLGKNTFCFVEEAVKAAVANVQITLNSSWLDYQKNDTPPVPELCPVATDDDCSLPLSHSGEYLRMVAQHPQTDSERPINVPTSSSPHLGLLPSGLPDLKRSEDALCTVLLLTDFETWIMEELYAWTEAQTRSEPDCESLMYALRVYMRTAREVYQHSPRPISVMLLTILEIWKALDTICLRLYPMMRDYPPELPEDVGFPLLLPHLSQLKSLDRIERYISVRWKNASSANPSIFAPLTNNSISVRYFEQSARHQDLYQEIERDATDRRERKHREWQERSSTYYQLKEQASQMDHLYSKNQWGDEYHNTHCCGKCETEDKADSMHIEVDEWPLPKEKMQAKAAVFELDCPKGFSAWRDATWTIVQDLGRAKSLTGDRICERLINYKLLKPYAWNHHRRIGLGSSTKTFIRSHYSRQKFPISFEKIAVNNGLKYRFFDKDTECWVQNQTSAIAFKRHCNSPLPDGPYSNLQDFTDTTTRTHNEAIASQQSCHEGISSHEFVEFASLRAGEYVQLLNILRQLGSSDLAFNAPAVHVLVRQAALQAGSSSEDSILRKAHTPFQESSFVNQLLWLLECHLSRVSANWKEQTRLAIIATLSLRTISLSASTSLVQRAVMLLREVRRVSLEWCRSISESLQECETQDETDKLRSVILRSALVCKMTFDVDSELVHLTLEDDSDFQSFIESSIYLHDNYPVRVENLPPDLKEAFLMEKKSSRRAMRRLVYISKVSESGMNLALGQAYGLSGLNGRWKPLAATRDRWITGSIRSKADGARQLCHYDLLTGEFLLDGRRVGRLPTKYTQLPIYERVFGSRILNVVGSQMAGMEYRTTKEIEGHEVHLCMRYGELLIETIVEGNHFRLIPHEVLEPDLPKHLTEDFVHWMDLETQVIEFRPLNTPWDSSKGKMTLQFQSDGKSCMKIGKKRLVDQGSQLGKSILDVLQPLEMRHRIMISADSDGVHVNLPRFRLSFFVNGKGLLESQQLGAVIDPNQNIGCLYGLRNKLALRNTASHPRMLDRSVIIPYGPLSISKCGNYSRVECRLGSVKQIHFMRYQLDEKLSQLRGHSEASSKLFLAYLHAITSSGLPDPLTTHSGTHEALRILCEQSLRVSTPLDGDALSVLDLIAALTPQRQFYPPHLRKMQTVQWQAGLSQLAQHEEFSPIVEDIITHSRQLEMLFDGQSTRLLFKNRGDAHLLQRALNRSSSVRNTVLGARERHDSPYAPRDGHSNSARAQRVFQISSLVRHWPERVDVITNLLSLAMQWNSISGYGQNINPLARTCNELLEFPLGQEWGAVYDFCRSCRRETDQYKLMHFFTMVSFAQSESVTLVRTLLAIACSGLFAAVQPPKSSYDLRKGEKPTHAAVRDILERYIPDPVRHHGEKKALWSSRLAKFRSEKSRELESVAARVMIQWPRDDPEVPQPGNLSFSPGVNEECQRRFTAWNDNRKYLLHLKEVQAKLRSINSIDLMVVDRTCVPKPLVSHDSKNVVIAPNLADLLCDRDPPLPRRHPDPYSAKRQCEPASHSAGLLELEEIVDRLRTEGDDARQRYASDLQASLESFKATELEVTPKQIPCGEEDLIRHTLELSSHVDDTLREVKLVLGPKSPSEHLLHDMGLWPRINTASLLICLSTRRRKIVPDAWRRILTSIGESIAFLQRSERLLGLSHRNDILGFYKEAEEPGHQSWDAYEYPDWLLIEIENNLTIREIQVEVAQKMIRSTDDKNSVLQLNMGEGKSSVIVPMIMTVLSNGEQLARIVVIKPLLKQTQHLLSQRLGGLVDRRIFHAPFTRENCLDAGQISALADAFKQCLHDRGVAIALPEHMMSFRLMGRERISTQPESGWQLAQMDKWLTENCRDVLDESDEILDPRFQLVYSMGNQRLMDEQPDRWVITQRLLSLFAEQAYILQRQGSQGVEVDYLSSSYPRITFLDLEAGPIILDMLVKEISSGNLIGISFSHCTTTVRQAVEHFLRKRDTSQRVFDVIRQEFSGSEAWGKLHLLRGLIAHNILLFAFQQKRWLVNYGLDLSRCMMAVPYRAKGVPSISAEFGHPDVAIVLTCLSYYYSGLTPAQLRLAFKNLFRESDPPSEYASWAKDCHDLPLQSLSGVNLEDEHLWEGTIFPHLRYSKSAADYFMASVVFPHEGKEFPAKLSTSAWDIPSQFRSTTGFSGTNDNKFLLPLSIPQSDLPCLHRTNAMVISMLLREENRGYLEAKDSFGKKLDTSGLLKLLCTLKPAVKVLIDVGAQVLESTNHDVAKEWLELASEAKAAVYFDASDELIVIDRGGFIERLVASPYHRNLDGCLVYLDEVHTRGVDLSMPSHTHAAVTLGPRTTKDRLVQACMRLRKLGCHQSLIFLAPPEVHREVRALSSKPGHTSLDSADVVRWCFEQTCRGTDSMKPLWIMQGLEHCYRSRLCTEFLQSGDRSVVDDPSRMSNFSSLIQEPEGRTLQDMYGAGSKKAAFRPCIKDEEARKDPTARLLLSEWETFTESQSKDWTLQEEQEREIAHEVEQERELQRPPPAVPLPHKLHDAVLRFIRTGQIAATGSVPFTATLDSLRLTSAYQHLHVSSSPRALLVTEDFANTVKLHRGSSHDEFIRPVNWVLSSKSDSSLLLLISQFEANGFMPEIRESTEVRLHLYSANISKSMHHFEDLSFYTVSACSEKYIPVPLLTAQLSLFAGSLFFEDYAAYKMACDFLGILNEGCSDEKDVQVGSDGFVDRRGRILLKWPADSPFEKSPILFFKTLVGIRRKGHLYSQTHLGHLLGGRMLTTETFGKA